MKITVNRAEFLEKAPVIPVDSDVSLMVSNGILTISSFTAGMTLKIIGYMTEPGQAFLAADKWHALVHDVYKSKMLVVDIIEYCGDT